MVARPLCLSCVSVPRPFSPPCFLFGVSTHTHTHTGEKKIKESEGGWTSSLQLYSINVDCGFGYRVPHLKLADVEYQNYTYVVDQHFPNPLLSVSWSKVSLLLNKRGIRKTVVFHNTGGASGFSGSLQFFFGDYEDRFGVLFFGVSFVFPVYKVLFLIIIVSAFQRPKITSWLINSRSNFSHRKCCSIHSEWLFQVGWFVRIQAFWVTCFCLHWAGSGFYGLEGGTCFIGNATLQVGENCLLSVKSSNVILSSPAVWMTENVIYKRQWCAFGFQLYCWNIWR